jgi:hypothetical protein
MFRPELLRDDDPALEAARRATDELPYGPVTTLARAEAGADPRIPAIAAWSLVHGLATLWLAHNLPADIGADPDDVARTVARHLFMPSGATPARG